ncbi:hypothetical protein H4R33_004376 [Dimargaris cristalligena]|nr:hypothetical protein H4R33_004376 [Dimargaris cristalligena]
MTSHQDRLSHPSPSPDSVESTGSKRAFSTEPDTSGTDHPEAKFRKKPGRKAHPNAINIRKEKNRTAQRNYRQRKECKTKALEEQVRALKQQLLERDNCIEEMQQRLAAQQSGGHSRSTTTLPQGHSHTHAHSHSHSFPLLVPITPHTINGSTASNGGPSFLRSLQGSPINLSPVPTPTTPSLPTTPATGLISTGGGAITTTTTTTTPAAHLFVPNSAHPAATIQAALAGLPAHSLSPANLHLWPGLSSASTPTSMNLLTSQPSHAFTATTTNHNVVVGGNGVPVATTAPLTFVPTTGFNFDWSSHSVGFAAAMAAAAANPGQHQHHHHHPMANAHLSPNLYDNFESIHLGITPGSAGQISGNAPANSFDSDPGLSDGSQSYGNLFP